LFKLEKLKILAYSDPERKQSAGVFEAMFNPSSYMQTHSIPWTKQLGMNSSGQTLSYVGSFSGTLSLNLVLDGTGVDELGAAASERKSVKERVQNFFDTTLHYNGNIHEPYYLSVEWGSLKFLCRLAATTIKYTAFERNGDPLRAELTVQLSADLPPDKRAKLEGKKSADLTHSRIVRQGDTLPSLTKQIYGSADRYLEVARFNGLDDFRRLIPGQELIFPPLTQILGRSAAGQG
jgi:hypothetical protein